MSTGIGPSLLSSFHLGKQRISETPVVSPIDVSTDNRITSRLNTPCAVTGLRGIKEDFPLPETVRRGKIRCKYLKHPPYRFSSPDE